MALVLALCAAGLTEPVLAQDQALGADLQGLLDFAKSHSPELAAMRQEADAAAERVQPAGAWPDPVLRVELMNFNNYGNGGAPNLLPSRVGETKYTVMQALPAWGKRDLRRDVAASQAGQATARADAAWAELAMRIKAGYADYQRVVGNERLVREVLDLMIRLEQVAQVRYAAGLGPQVDAIRAQLEQTAMRSELLALEGEKLQVQASLNALLARDVSAAWVDPGPPRALPAWTTAEAISLIERARAGNPQLRVERAGLSGAQKNRDLTLRNRYPDVQVGLSPSQVGSRITTWGLMFELNIPLQQATRRSQEREADAMVQAARSRVDAAANQLLGEIAVKLAAFDTARRSEALLRSRLLPQSEASLQSALAAYENGKLDFATLLDAQRQIRKARQDILRSQVEAQMRLAEIERILGEEL